MGVARCFPPILASNSNTNDYNSADVLAYYQLPGQRLVPVKASGISLAVEGSGNYGTEIDTFAGAVVKVCYNYTPKETPCCVQLTKKASKSEIVGGAAVTYVYAVTNCGNSAISNVQIKDDNGTPGNTADDFVVGTIESLAGGRGQTFTNTLIPVQPLCGILNNLPAVIGSLSGVVLPNGDVKVTYLQSTALNDNTYGTGSIDWAVGAHPFSKLTGSDKAQFAFYNGAGGKVFDGFCDYISQSVFFPSGYGCLGFTGGDGGNIVAGSSALIASATTTLATTLNNPPYGAANTTDSPLPVGSNPLWSYVNGYEVVIKAAAFGASGFGRVEVPIVHNSPAKIGDNAQLPTPCGACVTNTATLTATSSCQEAPLTASATAIVCVTGTGGGGGGGGGLPSPWETVDIGYTKKGGSASYSCTTFTVAGSGVDIGAGGKGSKKKTDDLRYVYQQVLSGKDCSLVARVMTISNTDAGALAGVMIRESLAVDARELGVFVTPSQGVKSKSRLTTGGATTTTTVAGKVVPIWVKVERVGTDLKCYYSADGSNWGTAVATQTGSTGALYIGLAVCSHDKGKLCTATFESVTKLP